MIEKLDLKTTCYLVLGLSFAIFIASLLAAYGPTRSDLYKGTWIWEAAAITTHREKILDFSVQNGVNHIYLYIDRNKVTPNDYALFIKNATEHQIKVEALGGDPSWGWRKNRQYIQNLIEWVASYNIDVQENERFSGIHLDIEPYLLPEWETDQSRVVEEWLSNMEFAANQAEWLIGLNVTVDLPFWVHKIEVPGYENYFVGSWMFKRFDTVVIMDYRDTAEGNDGIVSNALDMAREASAMNKSLIVGVEMAPSNEDHKITFYEEGHGTMEQELDITRRHLEKFSGFQGFAIHGFPYWISSTEGESD